MTPTVHYFVHADKVTMDSGKMAAVAGGLSHMGRGATPLQTSTQVFEHFQAPGNPDQHETTVVKDSHSNLKTNLFYKYPF